MTLLKNITTLVLTPLLIGLYFFVSVFMTGNTTDNVSTLDSIDDIQVMSVEEKIESKSDIMEFEIKDVSDLYFKVKDLEEGIKTVRIIDEDK